jgi:hypothetical protein
MNISNIKELKEFIKDLPDEMPVRSCCSWRDSCVAYITERWDDDTEQEYKVLEIVYND